MKYFLVSDDADTCTGLRLAGVFFMLAANEKLAKEALEMAVNDPEVGVLMITAKIRELCPLLVEQISEGSRPVLVEIPDSKNESNSAGSVGDYIKATVGISI